MLGTDRAAHAGKAGAIMPDESGNRRDCFPHASPKRKSSLALRPACSNIVFLQEFLERAKGFEPSTPTLARLCSTPELRPRSLGEFGILRVGRRIARPTADPAALET